MQYLSFFEDSYDNSIDLTQNFDDIDNEYELQKQQSAKKYMKWLMILV